MWDDHFLSPYFLNLQSILHLLLYSFVSVLSFHITFSTGFIQEAGEGLVSFCHYCTPFVMFGIVYYRNSAKSDIGHISSKGGTEQP